MQSHIIKKPDLAISFNNLVDIKSLLSKLVKILRVKNPEQFASRINDFNNQFIVATDRRTYLLSDVFNYEIDPDIKFLTAQVVTEVVDEEELTKGVTVSAIDIKKAIVNGTLGSLKLTNNKLLASLVLNLSTNLKTNILTIDLPHCVICKLPMIFPAITIYGNSYEMIPLKKLTDLGKEDPIAKSPITRFMIGDNKSLEELIWLVFTTRQKFLIKRLQDPAQMEMMQEMSQKYDEEKDLVTKHLNVNHELLQQGYADFLKCRVAAQNTRCVGKTVEELELIHNGDVDLVYYRVGQRFITDRAAVTGLIASGTIGSLTMLARGVINFEKEGVFDVLTKSFISSFVLLFVVISIATYIAKKYIDNKIAILYEDLNLLKTAMLYLSIPTDLREAAPVRYPQKIQQARNYQQQMKLLTPLRASSVFAPDRVIDIDTLSANIEKSVDRYKMN